MWHTWPLAADMRHATDWPPQHVKLTDNHVVMALLYLDPDVQPKEISSPSWRVTGYMMLENMSPLLALLERWMTIP